MFRFFYRITFRKILFHGSQWVSVKHSCIPVHVVEILPDPCLLRARENGVNSFVQVFFGDHRSLGGGWDLQMCVNEWFWIVCISGECFITFQKWGYWVLAPLPRPVRANTLDDKFSLFSWTFSQNKHFKVQHLKLCRKMSSNFWSTAVEIKFDELLIWHRRRLYGLISKCRSLS